MILSPKVKIAAVGLALVVVAACGGDGESEGRTTLSEADQTVVSEHLDRLGLELLHEYGDIGAGGMSYSPADGFVTGFVTNDLMTPTDKCQVYSDMLGELDGAPSTVPVRIITYTDDGFDVLAEGEAGGTCQE